MNMPMRDQMARAIYDHLYAYSSYVGDGVDLTRVCLDGYFDLVKLMDAMLDMLLFDPGHNATASVVKPGDDRTAALTTFHAIIQAIKDGK